MLQYRVDRGTVFEGGRVPVGYPVNGLEVLLLDPEGDQTDGRGEIAIRNPHVALGYWNRPEQTALTFVPDPDGGFGARLYRTGDLGQVRIGPD